MPLSIFSIPPHRAFADALVAGLMAQHRGDPSSLARVLLLVPNNRAVRAITDAFVRRSEGGLLLPRMVPIGDPDLGERIGGSLDPIDPTAIIPPAVDPLERRLRLARLVQRQQGVDAIEAFRLATDLARTLDHLTVEEVEISRVRGFVDDTPDLSSHWQMSLRRLEIILDEWPRQLAAIGRIDLADRRNRLLNAVERRWRSAPPDGAIVAAGITTTAPAVARLLGRVARMERGSVVFPGLDLTMPAEEWDSLGPDEATGEGERPRRSIETHPQFALKLLLDRMSAGRDEVQPWRWGGGRDAPAVRTRAIGHAMAPASFTARWQNLPPAERRLTGVRAAEAANPAEEARVIALALREAIERPGETAALVTPDRMLARRVSAQLARWGIEADDSAGLPLSQRPPGAFILAIAQAASERLAPVALLGVLKHPQAMRGEDRLEWLDGARLLDRALRGPRPAPGLAGIATHLADHSGRDAPLRARAEQWWSRHAHRLAPIDRDAHSFAEGLAVVREVATDLSEGQVWAGADGRAAADLFEALEGMADLGPDALGVEALPQMLRVLMDEVAVRPPYGQHPRIFIWGLLEARLQQADLMILSGLNEGAWPASPVPDPWLAPRIRADLGLPGLDRRIGLAAHDFASALGGRHVLVTRARRDARAPAVASRFWLRLEAMTGGMTRAPLHARWAQALDRPRGHHPAEQPKPCPPASLRPKRISVTEVDRLKADPFAFYARRMLRLSALDALDADPSPAWRGSAVHSILDQWMKEDECRPDRLRRRAEALLQGADAHPLMRALWQPRLVEAIDWIAQMMQQLQEEGRQPIAGEAEGRIEIAGLSLTGVADRVDRLAGGGLALIDYKTGSPPSNRAISAGFALQLGLLGLIARRGGFAGIEGMPEAFEYWSLARRSGSLGFIASPTAGRQAVEPTDLVASAERNLVAAAARWLTGDEPFTAKLHPEYAPYGEFDQLMRLDEWYGREASTTKAVDF